MKIKCLKNQLLPALVDAGHLASTRATLPILQNIFLEANKDILVIKATDLEQTYEKKLAVEIIETGKITVPARLIVDFLQNNPDQEVSLETNDLNLAIKSANHSAKLRCQAAEDYPELPKTDKLSRFSFPSNQLKEMISKTIFAASLDESRPVLGSLLWRFKEGSFEMVGTDGYRLAYYKSEFKEPLAADCIVPRRSLTELNRSINGEQVEVAFNTSQLALSFDQTTFTTRVLEGNYPDYQAILPKKSQFEIDLDGNELLQSLKLASLFSRDSAYSTKLSLADSILKVSSISPQLGESSNTISLKGPVKEPLAISINAQYLIDVLNVLSGEIKLSLNDANSPLVVRSADLKDYLYLIMPLRSE